MRNFLRALCLCCLFAPASALDPADSVDMRIGVADEASNCVIGPQLPFGSIDGRPWTQAVLSYGQIRNGARIRFRMGPRPSAWGK